MDKCFKMLSVGVPRSGVTQKMIQDEMKCLRNKLPSLLRGQMEAIFLMLLEKTGAYSCAVLECFTQSDFLCVGLKAKRSLRSMRLLLELSRDESKRQ